MEISIQEYHGKLDVSSSGSLHVEFYLKPERVGIDPDSGMPRYEDREFVMIHYPGGKDRQSFPVNDSHRRRWAEKYARFKLVGKDEITGMPCAQWPVATSGQVDLLRVLNIFSVEQLAECSDAAIERVGLGGRELREKAKNYLKAAKDGSFVASITAQIQEIKDDNLSLRDENRALKEELEALRRAKEKKEK